MTDPDIFTPEDHGLTAAMVDDDAVKVVRRLKEGGHQAYIVGGAVRDLLLNKRPKDFDVATDATPEQIKALFRNSRIIGRRFKIAHVYFKNRKVIEVSTFRREPDRAKEEIEVEQANNVWGTPEDDARRRDLTINAFFLDPDEMSVLDYNAGMTDMKEGRIRIIGNPEVRFTEDPVRMIRAIRHAARTGFLIEDGAWETINEMHDLITQCNDSRVRQEFIREFQEGAAARSVKMLYQTGLLNDLLPEMAEFLDTLHSRQAMKRTYWKLLKLLDKEGAQHDLDPSLIFAAALGPAIVPGMLELFIDKPKFDIKKIQSRLGPYLRAVGIPKSYAEPLTQALFAQPKLDSARQSESLPKRLTSKSYFPLAMHLFVLRHRAIGSMIPEKWEAMLPKLVIETTKAGDGDADDGPPKNKRRGRSRRGRSRGKGSGSQQGNSNKDQQKPASDKGDKPATDKPGSGRKRRRRRRRSGGPSKPAAD